MGQCLELVQYGVQAAGIEEDLEEYKDDRGHSAHHPGYRRRQLRFLSLKIFSQVCLGHNKRA